MFRLIGLAAIIPATLLLTVSFFVLFAIRKIETQGLKAFGYLIAVLLWLATILISAAGTYIISTGRYPRICPMREMLRCKMHGMMKANMPVMMPDEAR